MKLILEIRENKANFILELLKNFRFVKVKKVDSKKEEFLKGLKEAVEEVNLHKQGKIKLTTFDEFLDEL